jgi:hypothetical protein
MSGLATKMADFLKSGDESQLDAFEAEVNGSLEDKVDETEEEVESPEVEDQEEESQDDNQEDDEDIETSEEVDESPDQTEEPVAASHIRKIGFTNHRGRGEVEIDLSDYDLVAKHIARSYASQKWKAEKDQAQTKVKELETKITEVAAPYARLEEAWGEGGAEGIKNVITALAGDEKALDHLLDARQAERAKIEAMDPTERLKFEHEQESIKQKAAYDRELSKIRQEREAASTAKEEAEYQETRQRASSVFGPYSFHGQLGNAEEEAYYGTIVWEKSVELLESKGIRD